MSSLLLLSQVFVLKKISITFTSLDCILQSVLFSMPSMPNTEFRLHLGQLSCSVAIERSLQGSQCPAGINISYVCHSYRYRWHIHKACSKHCLHVNFNFLARYSLLLMNSTIWPGSASIGWNFASRSYNLLMSSGNARHESCKCCTSNSDLLLPRASVQTYICSENFMLNLEIDRTAGLGNHLLSATSGLISSQPRRRSWPWLGVLGRSPPDRFVHESQFGCAFCFILMIARIWWLTWNSFSNIVLTE